MTLILLAFVYACTHGGASADIDAEGTASPPQLGHRDLLAAFAESRGLKTGAELGIQHGGFAKHNLRAWPSCTSYIMVDAWKHQDNDVDATNDDDDVQEKSYKQAMDNVKEFQGKVKVMRMWTSVASEKVADDSLDFVYVDARHDYCGVLEDLVNWYPKLKVGGIFAGHDYLNADDVKQIDSGQDWSICQDGTINKGAVKGAVQEFAAKVGVRKIYQTAEMWPSFYWIREPVLPNSASNSN